MQNEFSIDLKKISGLVTDLRTKKLVAAIAAAEKAINSPEFDVFFLNTPFMQLTAEQQQMSKVDLLATVKQKALFNYYIEKRSWWKRFSTVMGWEDSLGVHTYADTFDGLSVAGLAGHLTHESMHALGLVHSFDWNAARDKSAPYMIGNWVEAQVGKVA